MFLRNDQNVCGSLRIDVFKSERVLVFVDPLGGNLARDYPAKQTVGHGEVRLIGAGSAH
jgi:hypothetical protein